MGSGFAAVGRMERHLHWAGPSDSSARYSRRKGKRIAVFCAPSELGLLYCQASNCRMRCSIAAAEGRARHQADDFVVQGRSAQPVAPSGVPEFGSVVRQSSFRSLEEEAAFGPSMHLFLELSAVFSHQ